MISQKDRGIVTALSNNYSSCRSARRRKRCRIALAPPMRRSAAAAKLEHHEEVRLGHICNHQYQGAQPAGLFAWPQPLQGPGRWLILGPYQNIFPTLAVFEVRRPCLESFERAARFYESSTS